MTDTIPIYPWFDQAPEHCKTKNQLAEEGLRPGGPVVAKVVWQRGKRRANLYDRRVAVPKRPATVAQRAALEKAQQARCTCRRCGTVYPYVLGPRWRSRRDCGTCRVQHVQNTAQEWLANERAVILDLETTDLEGYIVQIAIITLDGTVVLDTLVNPLHPITDEAQQIHGITPEQVQDAPVFGDLLEDLLTLLQARAIYSYNVAFETTVLRREIARIQITQEPADQHLVQRAQAWSRSWGWECVMRLYAQYIGHWSTYYRDFRAAPLPGGNHTALGDCHATLALLRSLTSAEEGINE